MFFMCSNTFLGRFGFHFGTILEQFWDRKSIKNLLNFERASGSDVGSPRAPSKAKNHDFHLKVVQNRGSTFSRPSASGVDFGSQNGAKMEARSEQNLSKNRCRNLSEKVLIFC